MVGWPTEKWWSESQLGWLFHSQYDGKVIKHVPNHQPVIFSLTFFSRDGMGISNLGIQEKLVTLHDQLWWFQVIPKTIRRASCWSRWISSSSMGLSQANSPALGKNCAASMTPKMASMTTRKFGGAYFGGGACLVTRGTGLAWIWNCLKVWTEFHGFSAPWNGLSQSKIDLQFQRCYNDFFSTVDWLCIYSCHV